MSRQTGDGARYVPLRGRVCGIGLRGALAGDGFAEPFEQAFELGHALAQIGLPLLEAPETFLDALGHPVDASFEPVDVPVEPADTPVELADVPVELADTPVELADVPVEPVDVPVEPADTPVEPVDTRVEPRTLPKDETGERHADGEDRDELGGQ